MEILKEKGYYVYLILCEDNSLYCGWTTNLLKRFNAHKSGKGAKYTRSHKPLEIYYYESLNSKSEACRREWEIKKMSHDQKIKLKNE